MTFEILECQYSQSSNDIYPKGYMYLNQSEKKSKKGRRTKIDFTPNGFEPRLPAHHGLNA